MGDEDDRPPEPGGSRSDIVGRTSAQRFHAIPLTATTSGVLVPMSMMYQAGRASYGKLRTYSVSLENNFIMPIEMAFTCEAINHITEHQ